MAAEAKRERNRCKGFLSRRAGKKRAKHQANLFSLSEPTGSKIKKLSASYCKSTNVFVDGGDAPNPRIPLPKCANKNDVVVLSVCAGDLYVPMEHIVNPKIGLMSESPQGSKYPALLMLLPRDDALLHTGMNEKPNRCIELCRAFDKATKGAKCSLTRGNTKTVVTEPGKKYICLGTQPSRSSTGVREENYVLQNLKCVTARNVILKMFVGIEQCVHRWASTESIRFINEAYKLNNPKTFSIESEEGSGVRKQCKIFGSMAIGENVFLSGHQDHDFFYSATTIHMRRGYSLEDEVVAYFCFLRIGLAIPLRPGDVLLFNPMEPHCVSSRCRNEDSIFCVSLYMKSANLGHNNNSMPLTDDEKSLNEKFKK